jgi:putative PIN family toxin of toxin-antitoxin system
MRVEKPKRLVIDTNLWISFLISDTYHKLDKRIQNNSIKLLFSEEFLSELLSVFERPKLKKYFSKEDVNELLSTINQHADFIEVTSNANACRDKKDNFLLALCEDGKADYLLTGDSDLLDLVKYKKTKILKFSDYLLLI